MLVTESTSSQALPFMRIIAAMPSLTSFRGVRVASGMGETGLGCSGFASKATAQTPRITATARPTGHQRWAAVVIEVSGIAASPLGVQELLLQFVHALTDPK